MNRAAWEMCLNFLEQDGTLHSESIECSNEFDLVHILNGKSEIKSFSKHWLEGLKLAECLYKKSTSLSIDFRQKGNDLLRTKPSETDVIADLYTEAIFAAPSDSQELGLAHANRAEMFLRLDGLEQEGYDDCKMAIKYKYPESKMAKLLNRKLKFAAAIGNKKLIEETHQEFKNNKLCEKEFNMQLLKNLKINKKESNVSGEEIKNKNIIVKSSPKCGRYTVADEWIKKDEAIYKEKAFVFIPIYHDYDNEYILYHCQNCAATNCYPFPCYDCSRASYCSPKCRDEHFTIHQYECAAYKMNLWKQIGIAHLAFRCLIVGLPSAVEKLKIEKNLTTKEFLTKIETLKDFQYRDVILLISNFDKMDKEDYIRYGLSALVLSIYLIHHTTFINDLKKQNKNLFKCDEDWNIVIVILLTKHMGQLVANGHAISDMELIRPTEYESYILGKSKISLSHMNQCMSSTRIFTAIFPTISLLNHSCDPNIYNEFNGMELTIHASKDIKQNEEIFNCYGPQYKLLAKKYRKKELKEQYCFDCECDKCINYDKTVRDYFLYLCPECDVHFHLDFIECRWWNLIDEDAYCRKIAKALICLGCKKPIAFTPSNFKHFLSAASDCMISGDEEILEFMLDYYFFVEPCLYKYHEVKQKMATMILGQKMTKNVRCFAKLAYVAADYFRLTQDRFGIHSMEFVMASSYALTILEMIENGNIDENVDTKQITKLLNKKRMIESWSILSKNTASIFQNYLQDIERINSSADMTKNTNTNKNRKK